MDSEVCHIWFCCCCAKGRHRLERHSPPDIGGVDATSKRSREASFNGADGVVQNGGTFQECILKHSVNPNHPVCAAAVASHLFLDGAATPPVSGGELRASHPFVASISVPAIDPSSHYRLFKVTALQ